MTAIRLRQPASLDNLALGTADAPPPGPGEVRVAIRAASLNYRDLLVVTGVFPVADGLVPLSDAAGEVVEVGHGVTEFVPGDRVISLFHPNWRDGHMERAELDRMPGAPQPGFACTHATRPASHFTRAPAGLDWAEAATLPCAAVTAWRALFTDGGLKAGQTVLVLGSGGVSLFALQLAKAAGARVVATSSSPEKCERLRAMGADHAIDYRANPEWGQEVLAATGGHGADIVVEVGGPATFAQSLAAARTGAHIAIIGATGGFDGGIPFIPVQSKRLRLQGVTVGSRRDQLDLVAAIEANGLRPLVDRRFPLERLADAFRCLQSGDFVGKICVEM